MKTDWPKYTEFESSLPSRFVDYLPQIDEILNLPLIFGFKTLGSLLKSLGISITLSPAEYNDYQTSNLSSGQKTSLQKKLFMSPKLYFEEKFIFESKIQNGQFTNFLDHLKYYNGTNWKNFNFVANISYDKSHIIGIRRDQLNFMFK